jgi:hypothetical protein
VESRLSEITDPKGVPSGASYIAETADSVEALEFSLLMIGGGGVRVSPLSLYPPVLFPSPLLRAGKSSLKGGLFSLTSRTGGCDSTVVLGPG